MQNCKKTELAERLATICTNEHIKIKTLADISGVLPQSLYDIKNGKIKTLSVEKARSINRVYPQYSVSWLITGENAEAFLTTSTAAETNNQPQDDKDKTIAELRAEVATLKEQVTNLTQAVLNLSGK